MLPISPRIKAFFPLGEPSGGSNGRFVQVGFVGNRNRNVVLESEPPGIFQFQGSQPSGVNTSGFEGRATGQPRAAPLSDGAIAAIVIAAIVAVVLVVVGVCMCKRRRAKAARRASE
jgi:hypothetical protein